MPFTKENISKRKIKSQIDQLLAILHIFLSILVILNIVPNINWPNNTLEDRLDWDAGEYHFPKAVELYKTGSVWDFSISYGEYPFGYESTKF